MIQQVTDLLSVPHIVADPDRLAVLESYSILDTPTEVGFDDVVRLAAHICDAPVALVSLVAGDRQWFKARIGLDERETDINSSVCQHALSSAELLVIPDLSRDERTRANPLVVADPHIRFYAGAPLITAEGVPLGSLCVIDTEPRPEGLSDIQANMLETLARQVMSQLELRRALAERDAAMADKLSIEALEQASSTLYRTLFDAIDAGFCIIEMKFVDGVAVDYRFAEINRAFEAQTGLSDARGRWMLELAPDHEQHWFDLYGNVALTGEAVRYENQASQLDGRWFEVHGFPIESSGGNLVGVLFNDISARKQVENARRESEAMQVVINQELSHRMKNMFAMVQAIAGQTLRSVSEKDAVDAFSSRLQALSKAHDVLLHQNWTAARIGVIIRTVLGSLERIDRFDISGPEVELGARATLSVSLLLHELTTNAIKYGAFASEAGRVSVDWSVEDSDTGAELVLRWLESGGPAIAAPSRRGFGSKLIAMGLVGAGGVTLDYQPAGLRAEFRAPMNQMNIS